MYKSFFGVVALDGMNFSMDEGEIRCLIGENGCGKSTMIKVISGFYTYDRGELEIGGRPYRRITPAESFREGIQVIYQDFSLFPNMTIAENIMMYSTVAEGKPLINAKKTRERAVETLQKIHFDIDPDLYVSELNVAQKQMVAICRAIVQDAKLLVMDEPTTALTTREVEKLFEVVRKLKSHGVAVLFVSHKLDEVLEICESITVMRNGKNVYDSELNGQMLSKEELIYYMTGKRFDNARYEYRPVDAEPLMEVRGYTLPGKFEDVSFSLHRGEIMGVTGLLGCGRGELAEALFGLRAARGGTVLIDGREVGAFKRVDDALAHGIAYVPEDRLTEGLHLDQRIAENSVSRVVGDFAGPLGALDLRGLARQKEKGLSSMYVAGMKPENPAKSLSGGNQQKIVLIKWLASNPRILILNCPTVGVDVGAKSDIHETVRRLAADKGVGVIVISDDILEIMQLCNRVIIMKNGRFDYETPIADTTMEQLEARLAQEEAERGAKA